MTDYFPSPDFIPVIKGEQSFRQECLRIFMVQYQQNEVYKRFCNLLNITSDSVSEIFQIPFLPVEVFRTHRVQCGQEAAEKFFSSSGTSGETNSMHYINNLPVYDASLLNGFEIFYGSVKDYCILALLPSYLERSGSSLVYMVQKLMQQSGHPDNGFFLYDHKNLAETLERLINKDQKTMLIGVSFALLDFSEKFPIPLPEHVIVMETGGMKGRRREMVREELHGILCQRFQCPVIHSEYGMTELLSQAYSKGHGLFLTPPWMRILIRDINNPFRYLAAGKTGAINIIDLANINSCAFIATQDLGRINEDGSFEVLGRFDNSDVRGCNLMVS